ncbi:hypothetical protein ACVRW7_05640 [Streptococcus ratti]|uniref:Uncharacterized protein n=1 Tax=Streptococcus ratti FA-1 = DSM 20564 TaxID=699248 RepID=A0ABP2QWD7_STRRT|nr:hypothetical protein [Streptococcus ratti]EJN93177.1 hypothetical protein SRA_09818 [Streptococcus ratti FA-1 = DSM 20564]EMP70098.1 hypothetical protein D822_05492 [Streptococcus ratti FA-1 = DSM 20564]QEY06854.1 hypothetical protein FY406_03925 [Streptococcus ratti]VEI59268.1 Zn-dependent proteases [Streptococcus mutans]
MNLTIKEYKDIQYQINDNRRWLYNVRNDRMITSNHHLENYLKDVEEPDNPLYNFYTSPYKRGKLTNFHLIRLILDSSKINAFYKISLFLNKWYLTLLMLVSSFTLLPITATAASVDLRDFSLEHFSVWDMAAIYFVTTVVILPLHEYAHFSVYYKYLKPSKVTFGFSLRYFSMPVFFIKVPFYKILKGGKRNELVLAGVKFQVAIWFFLTLIDLLYPSSFLFGLIIVNLGLIITNLLPFLKLDGYWYLSNLLGVDDYMSYFKGMFSQNKKFRLDIFLLGIVNFLMIILSISSFIYNLLGYFI